MSTTKKVLIGSLIANFLFGLFLVFYPSNVENLQAEQALWTGKEDHAFTLTEAGKLTAKFRAEAPSWAVIALYFGKNAITQTLSQPGCVGIRLYYAKHEDGSPSLVMVGVDRNGNDIVKGHVSQKTVPCPPFCGDWNQLNKSVMVSTLDK